ncbi:hypothetical protein ES705_33487 [subsurface metagenome]
MIIKFINKIYRVVADFILNNLFSHKRSRWS